MAAGGLKVVGASAHFSQIEVALEWAWGLVCQLEFKFQIHSWSWASGLYGLSVLRVRETEEYTDKSPFHGGPNLLTK